MNTRPNTDPFLHSKLAPPRLHADVVPREELMKRLDEGLQRKLILISAPTGFGKTTLVNSWTASRGFRCAWVTFDPGDNDPARFWTYVISALRSFDQSLGRDSLSMLMSAQPPAFQALLAPLLNELEGLKEACVLVLEDFHSIASPEIEAGLGFLLQHLPEALHLVLLTRSDPDLPLPLLRARGEMIDINAADLRFSQAETTAFLQRATGTEPPASVIRQVQSKTEGWPAGLRLLALSYQSKGNAADLETLAESFSGSNRYVADYLTREVFESQPTPVQDFLLKTCFLERLTGPLCDALGADTEKTSGAQRLEELERQGLFIEQLARGWYRYNPLFAESIQHLARQRLSQNEVLGLYEKASGWYESQGLQEDAVETALKAGLYEHALRLIEAYIEVHELSEIYTFSRWIEAVPRAEILRRPLIAFTYAQIILYTADRYAPSTAARIEPFLQAAESAWQAAGDGEHLGQLLAFRGNEAWWQGELPRAFAYAHQALGLLPEQDVLWRGVSLLTVSQEALNAGHISQAQDQLLEARALLGAAQNIYGTLAAILMLTEVFYSQGEFEQAEQLGRQIVAEAVGDESMLDDQGIASLNLAHIAYERNELEQAEDWARRAAELAAQRAHQWLQIGAGIRLAYLRAARGEPASGRQALKELEAGLQNPALLRDLQDAQALLTLREDESAALDGWLRLAAAEPDKASMRQERAGLIRSRLLIAQGQPAQALELLLPWKEDAARNGRLRSRMEALCLEALARHASSDLRGATTVLVEALRLGELRGFRRTFLDEGRRMSALLNEALPSISDRALRLYASTLQHLLPAEGPAPSQTVEPLSAQEARVLRLLAAGLSNADIARELVVSTNTIKTQVKSIYRKLNVTSRQEAAQVARELKLL